MNQMNPRIAHLKEQIILQDFTFKSALLGIEMAIDVANKTNKINVDSVVDLLAHADKAQNNGRALREELIGNLIADQRENWKKL